MLTFTEQFQISNEILNKKRKFSFKNSLLNSKILVNNGEFVKIYKRNLDRKICDSDICQVIWQ